MNRRVSFAKRWRRWHQTVGTTLLWGADGLTWNRARALRLQRFEQRSMRLMLRLPRQDGESWPEWVVRSTDKARDLSDQAGLPSLLQRALLLKHRWAGHVARQSESPQSRLR